MTHQTKKIVLCSIVAILAAGLMVLDPSINAQAQLYDDEYGYDDSNYYNDYHPEPKRSFHVDIQKINCGNSNVNVNGIDITQIPQDDTATTSAANEGVAEADTANTQNGNGLGDRINFDRNLVNVCVNANGNEQVKVNPEDQNQITTTNIYTVQGPIDSSSGDGSAISIANCDLGDTVLSGSFFLQDSQFLTGLLTDGITFPDRQGWVAHADGGVSSQTVSIRSLANCFDNPPAHIP